MLLKGPVGQHQENNIYTGILEGQKAGIGAEKTYLKIMAENCLNNA